MRTVVWIIGCCASFVAGVAAAFVYFSSQTIRVNTDWIALAKPSSGGAVTYSTEAIFKSDIALPDVKEFSGKGKFISDESTAAPQRLGYLIHVVIAPLDLKKVPEKYLKEKPVVIEGVKTKRLPIEQVYFDVTFNFTLKDLDGFTLAELSSEHHIVESGKDNEFQNITPQGVSRDLAARTKTVVMQLYVQKCVTCQGE